MSSQKDRHVLFLSQVIQSIPNDFYSLFKDIFKNNINASKDLEKIRDKVINMFDGSDYADIIELGDSCRQRLI